VLLQELAQPAVALERATLTMAIETGSDDDFDQGRPSGPTTAGLTARLAGSEATTVVRMQFLLPIVIVIAPLPVEDV
jgi:hypothetical protein